MKRPLLIYGAGGLGREVLSLVNVLGGWDCIGFIDDSIAAGTMIKNLRVLGGIDYINHFKENIYLILSIGNPLYKARIVQDIKNSKVQYPNIIHPSVILQDQGSIQLGNGNIIGAGSVLTNDIKIGNHTLINLNVTIGHDSTIEDFCSIMPGVNIAGGVQVDEAVLLGSGANIMNHIRIGKNSKVGMGAVVIQDVPEGVTVVGVPAKEVVK